MADNSDLRISDADRERAAAALREHYAAGRLDSSELEDRTQAAYAARTEGELESLHRDLPALPPKPPTTMERARGVLTSNLPFRYGATGGGLFLCATAIWAVTGAERGFWPMGVLVLTFFAIRRGQRRGRRGPGGGGDSGRGSGYSYHYEYHYGDGKHEHRHEYGQGDE